MESPRERACPSCAAPAEAHQRWCLECGSELPGPRRAALRPAVGIATTLAVLVGAASAGGYTLLQEGKQPPPPATTVAQAPATTPPEALPPVTQEPLAYVPAPTPATTAPDTPTSSTGGAGAAGGSSSSSPAGGGTSGSTGGTSGDGSVEPTDEEPASTTPEEPRLVLTDIALGAAAVVYAPYATADVDLGDASRAVDGSARTAWKVPPAADPTASPQIGVYVDLAGRETIRKLVVRTPTPGMTIEVYGARSGPPTSIVDPGWDHLADRPSIGERTKIKLPSRPYRFVLVWITEPPADGARAAIAELSLLSLQPE
jgi:hypothetical protein